MPTENDDSILLGPGADTLYALGGNDTVDGAQGNDLLFGNAGDDSLFGNQDNDSLSGDEGNDTLIGGDGNDFLSGFDDQDQLSGGADGDTLFGGFGSDLLNGDGGLDLLNGEAGNDSAFGGADNDTLFGFTGLDSLDGGSGNDFLDGQEDNDTLNGGDNADSLRGGRGSDRVAGGEGNDTLTATSETTVFSPAADADTVRGEFGDDVINWFGWDTPGIDELSGGSGRDRLVVSFAGLAAGAITTVNQAANRLEVDGALRAGIFELEDVIFGGEGVHIGYSASERIEQAAADGSRLNASGAEGNDTLIGNAGEDTLSGGRGWDSILGGDGTDRIFGQDDGPQSASDTLRGEGGNDLIEADSADSVDGGSGNDNVYVNVSALSQSWNINLTAGATGLVSAALLAAVSSIEFVALDLGTGADSVDGRGGAVLALGIGGGGGADTIEGSVGQDGLFGGDGDDILRGNGGTDWIYGEGNADLLEGGADNDVLDGGAGGDTLDGGSGNDRLEGQAGADRMIGGSGNDTFRDLGEGDIINGDAGIDLVTTGFQRSEIFLRSLVVTSGPAQGGYVHAFGPTGDFLGRFMTVERLEVVVPSFEDPTTRQFVIAGNQQDRRSKFDGGFGDDAVVFNTATGQTGFHSVNASGFGVGFVNLLGSLPAGWIVRDTGNFGAQATSSLLVQNTANGAAYVVDPLLSTPSWTVVNANVTSAWQALAVGDFAGDFVNDVLFRDQTSGVMVFANMVPAAGDAPVFGGWAALGNLGTGWRMAGVADFDADGFSDVAVQRLSDGLTYYMNIDAGVFAGWGFISGAVGADWQVRTLGDLNADGFADVVFQNQANGNIWWVNMAGGANAGWGVVANGLSGWQARQTGDLNNDGFEDVLVQNTASGLIYGAIMGGGGFSGWTLIGSSGSAFIVV